MLTIKTRPITKKERERIARREQWWKWNACSITLVILGGIFFAVGGGALAFMITLLSLNYEREGSFVAAAIAFIAGAILYPLLVLYIIWRQYAHQPVRIVEEWECIVSAAIRIETEEDNIPLSGYVLQVDESTVVLLGDATLQRVKPKHFPCTRFKAKYLPERGYFLSLRCLGEQLTPVSTHILHLGRERFPQVVEIVPGSLDELEHVLRVQVTT